MKAQTKICIVFIVVHLFLITDMVVVMSFALYPHEIGHVHYRARYLEEIYNEVKLYQKETGDYPESIDSFWHYDEEKGLLFRSKELSFLYLPDEIDKIHYQLIDGEPVISDLGKDRKEGGLGSDMDAVYPRKYQTHFPFREFMKTKHFKLSLLYGFLLASGISLCLYGIWKKRLSSRPISLSSTIVVSVLFLLFELFLAELILGAHIYPHH
jgi:hypothetical protein